MRRFLSALAAAVLFPTASRAADEPAAQWIWKSDKPAEGETVFFRREFELPPEVTGATVTVVCDDWHRLWVNGHDLGIAGEWNRPRSHDIVTLLRKGGGNVIAIEGRNQSGAAGMALRLHVTLANGSKLFVMSDGNWRCSGEAPDHWFTAEFQAAGWAKAAVLGKMGMEPWGKLIGPDADKLALSAAPGRPASTAAR